MKFREIRAKLRELSNIEGINDEALITAQGPDGTIYEIKEFEIRKDTLVYVKIEPMYSPLPIVNSTPDAL